MNIQLITGEERAAQPYLEILHVDAAQERDSSDAVEKNCSDSIAF